jgi:hypothetical protein
MRWKQIKRRRRRKRRRKKINHHKGNKTYGDGKDGNGV